MSARPTDLPESVPGSRAVLRAVPAGERATCPACRAAVVFRGTRHPERMVLCNVYVDGRWHHLEHWHVPCYDAAGDPHGPVDVTPATAYSKGRLSGQGSLNGRERR